MVGIENARRFVARMRQDGCFRNEVLATGGPDELLAFLRKAGLPFNQRELVEAMAECMQQTKAPTGN